MQPRKKHKLPSGKDSFLSIMRIVAPSGLRLSSQSAHASQTDSQSGEVVQRSRGGRRQESGHTESDQGAIEANDKTIVGMDARHQRHGDPAQLHQFPETVGSDGDVRDFPGEDVYKRQSNSSSAATSRRERISRGTYGANEISDRDRP